VTLDSSPYLDDQLLLGSGADPLSIAVIGPDEDVPSSRLIRQMAGSVTGQPAPQGKNKGLIFGSFGRSFSSKITAEETLSITRLTPDPVYGGTTLGATQPDATVNIPGTFMKGADGQWDHR
jgi:hypothetical protein